ncbi:hypothetical protein ACFZBE_40845 [Streptomyces sp. NPDC008061]|uniref:hypothetical protein n=1 Tax=Streptomyces sp. NPDC008061 TaxID=3364805 RepID=UPI0036EF0813
MREICIPLHIDSDIDTFANLDRFALRAAKVVDIYREMMTALPRETDLSAEEVMAVMASTPVRRILERSADQASLKTAIVRRHNLLSQARPVTERNIDAIASRLAQRAGSDDCVDLAESFLGRLFPMGIRTPTVRDDLSTGTDRVEDRLVPGALWSQVAELVQVFHALTQDDGKPRLAVLLQQRDKGIGHVLVYARVRNPDNDGWKILRVDPQESSAPVREVTAQFPAVTDLASPPTTADPRSWQDRQWLHAGRGTRMVVIDHTGRTIDPTTLPDNLLKSQSASNAQPQLDAPTSHGYGALGWEAKFDKLPLRPAEDFALPSGLKLAENTRSGQKIVIDYRTVWAVHGQPFLSLKDAFDVAGGKVEPKKGVIPVLKVTFSSSRTMTPGSEKEGTRWENGTSDYERISALLRRPGRDEHPVQLTSYLPREEGWVFTPQGENMSVFPPLVRNNSARIHFNVDADIRGMWLVLAWAQDRISHPLVQTAAVEARNFARDVSAAFAGHRHSVAASVGYGEAIGADKLAVLGAANLEFLQMESYAWLMFSHASALPLRRMFTADFPTTDMLPVALRNPFHMLRRMLSEDVRSWLTQNADWIIGQVEYRLLKVIESYRIKAKVQVETRGIMKEVIHGYLTHRDYVTSMIFGRTSLDVTVSQNETVGLIDETTLVADSGFPLAALQLSITGVDDATFKQTAREIFDLAQHTRFVSTRFARWGYTPTPGAVLSILKNPLVENAAGLLAHLRTVKISGPSENGGAPILSYYQYRTALDAITLYGLSLPSEIVQRLTVIRTNLLNRLPKQGKVPSSLKSALEGIDATLQALQPHGHKPQVSLQNVIGRLVRREVPRTPSFAERGNDADILDHGRAPAFLTAPRAMLESDRESNKSVPTEVEVGRAQVLPASELPSARYSNDAARLLRRFEVRRVRLRNGEHESRVILRVFFDVQTSGDGTAPTPEQVQAVAVRAQQAIDTHYNNGLRLPSGDLLRIFFERVMERDGVHHTVRLHSAFERINSANWTVDIPGIAIAHESGHLLGWEDGYREALSGPRDVYDDGALMVGYLSDERGRAVLDNDRPCAYVIPGQRRITPRELRKIGAAIDQSLRASLVVGSRAASETRALPTDRPDGLPSRASFSLEVRQDVLYGNARGRMGLLPPKGMSSRPRLVQVGVANANGTYPAVLSTPADRAEGPIAPQKTPRVVFPYYWTEDDAIYAAEQAYLHALRSRQVKAVAEPHTYLWAGEYGGVRIEGSLRGGEFSKFWLSEDQAGLQPPPYLPAPEAALKANLGSAQFGRRVEDVAAYGNRRARTGAYHPPTAEEHQIAHGLMVNYNARLENETHLADVFFLDPAIRITDRLAEDEGSWRLHADGAATVMFPQFWSSNNVLDAVEEAFGNAMRQGMVKALDGGRHHWVGIGRSVKIEGLVRDGQFVAYRPTAIQPYLFWHEDRIVAATEPLDWQAAGWSHLRAHQALFVNGQTGVRITSHVSLEPIPGVSPHLVRLLRERLTSETESLYNSLSSDGGLLARFEIVYDDLPGTARVSIPVDQEEMSDTDVRKILSDMFHTVPERARIVQLADHIRLAQKPVWEPRPGLDPDATRTAVRQAMLAGNPLNGPTTLREPDPTDRDSAMQPPVTLQQRREAYSNTSVDGGSAEAVDTSRPTTHSTPSTQVGVNLLSSDEGSRRREDANGSYGRHGQAVSAAQQRTVAAVAKSAGSRAMPASEEPNEDPQGMALPMGRDQAAPDEESTQQARHADESISAPVRWNDESQQFLLDLRALGNLTGEADRRVEATAAMFAAAAGKRKDGATVRVGLTSIEPLQTPMDTPHAVQFLSQVVNSRLPGRTAPMTVVLTFPNGYTINLCSPAS